MKTVRILYTGGTIGGVLSDTVTENHHPKGFEKEIRKMMPSWAKNIPWDIRTPYRKLSEQLVPDDWTKLASEVKNAVTDEVGGVVIAHGTDTLVYSAAAVALMLPGLSIPVVFTGSNLPLESPESDALQNLMHAMAFAFQTTLAGVFVTFAGTPHGDSHILDGIRLRKDASRYDVFQPASGKPLGKVTDATEDPGTQMPRVLLRKQSGPSSQHKPAKTVDQGAKKVDASVAYFDLHPGFDPVLINAAVSGGIRALLLGSYGSGNLCTEGEYSLIPNLQKAISRGVAVYIVSKHYGDVSLGDYGSSALLSKLGCIGLKQMTPEVGLVKLMWALAQTKDLGGVANLMLENIAGELEVQKL